jgi:hypothetical protein
MLDCLIIGDSIAVGTHMFKPECETYSKGGINSWQFNQMWSEEDLKAGLTVISLGSNDHSGVNTRKELEKVRERVKGSGKIFWIMPAIKPNIQEIVRDVAIEHGDTVITINSLQNDKIHPSWKGYKEIASVIK